MNKIKVGIVGYGTIGKRVADAVLLQDDMELVGVTAHSYNYRMISAKLKNIPMHTMNGSIPHLQTVGNFDDLLKKVDIVVDCSPKKIASENIEKHYKPHKVKAIVQGGEKPHTTEASFVAQCNYKDAINKDYVRVVSCNTTGLSRTLNVIDKKYGIERVDATLIRRGADPWDIRHGPINAVVPVLELPSHHGPDVKTILPNMNIFTTAVAISSTLMHMHNVIVDCKETPNVDEVIKLLQDETRIRIVDNESMVRSTAEIMELAKDLGRNRADMPEIVVWREGIGVSDNKLLFMQAVHQESDVVCENIDAIRAMMGFVDAEASIKKTNETLQIDIGKY